MDGHGIEAVSTEMELLEKDQDTEKPKKVKGSQKIHKRPEWANKAEFVLACVGFAVGLGNVWRFPYLCYKNGGGAFLIPYFVFLLGAGIPLFVLEVGLGQYLSEGGISAWRISPAFKGVGYGTTIICFWLNIYYVVILAWSNLYFVFSFTTGPLPWSTCNNWWNTDKCFVIHSNTTGKFQSDIVDSTVEFWENRIQKMSTGIGDFNFINWELALSLLFSWIVCYFCIVKGVKSTGKVVYFTATFPYVMLFILFIRGVTLDGAWEGIVYYLSPDMGALLKPQVWMDAGTQIFFSYAIALGCMIALGSYNKFHNNFLNQCYFICLLNSATSIFAGLVIFSVLGFMAKVMDVPISKVADSGPGLVFIAYPRAVAEMPAAPVWSVLFFFMIFLLGLDSQFVGMEGFMTAVVDRMPHVFMKGHNRHYLLLVKCAVCYLCGLFLIADNGLYVFQIFDFYSASGVVLLLFSFVESICIGWIYGTDRFNADIKQMIGYKAGKWMEICWTFVTPLLTIGCFLFYVAELSPLKMGDYEFPTWATVLGWCMTLSSLLVVPVYIIYSAWKSPGRNWYQKLMRSTFPDLPENVLRVEFKDDPTGERWEWEIITKFRRCRLGRKIFGSPIVEQKNATAEL